jgi:CHASE2 domain-containing sensor protein
MGHWLEKQEVAIKLRYKIYQFMTQSLLAREAYVQRTVIVLITDEEYWKGELARRSPIKRDYLAKLIRALDSADPSVIAVDFDLRSQTADGVFVEHDDYKKETEEFLNAVKDVSQRRPIVLPKTIRFENGYYFPESDIYDQFNFQNGTVRTGYISLPFDYRKVPLSLIMKDGTTVDSFAQAIVRVAKEEALQPLLNEEKAPYGSYLPEKSFTKLSATDVLNATDDTKNKLRHNIVIIGGAWSNRAYGRGGRVDAHFTPVGQLSGVLLHANFVEALLDRRTSRSWGETALIVFEGILSLAVAVIFALVTRFLWKILWLFILLIVLAVFSYFSWLNLGLFYDFFVPTVLVVGHAIYEQIREWAAERRHEAPA